MRKFFSLIAAVLFAGSMLAADVVITYAGAYDNQATLDGVPVVQDGVTVTFAKGTGTSTPAYYNTGTGARTYGGNTITVDAGSNTITKIAFDFSQNNKDYTVNVGAYVKANSEWTGSASSVLFTTESGSGHNRIKSITVTLGEGGGDQPSGDTTVVPVDTTSVVPVVADPTNCAEAREAALSVSGNNEEYNGGKSYTIQGYVTEIAFAYDATKGNMSFWMADTKDGGKVLEAYKCTITSEENAPAVGDKVAVTGKLTKYNTTPEFAAGCTVTIIERAAGNDTIPSDTTIVVPVDTTVVPVAGTEVVITYAGAYDNQATLDGVPVVQDGVTVTFAKGTGTSTPAYYNTGTGARTYGGNTITVDAGSNTITKIAFDFSQNNKDYTVNVGAYVKANSEWTGSASSVLFTTESGSGHNRIKSITVTLGEGGGDTPGGDTPGGDTTIVVTDPTNCAEAAAAALTVSKNNEEYNGGKEYTIQGYVTEIAFAYDATKGNMSFWMADTKDGGKVLEAYKCTITSEENAPAVGDKVAVTGKLTKYNTTPEFATGCTVVIIEKAGGDTPGGDTTIVVTDPTNCAEAAAAALTVSKNNEEYNGGKEYTIQGYVTEIAFAYDATKGNMSFWMADTKDGGKVLEAYKCTITSEENAPAVGDKVAVTGKLTKYNTTPEFATGCTVVIIEKAGGDTPGGDDPVVTDPTNCAEAAAAALTVSKNNELYNGGKEYTIEGYVTAIQTAFNSTYKQVSFWMADTENGGNVLQAYRAVCETAADAPAVGDKVAVTGKLTKYNTTPEFAQGCTYVITQKTTNLPVNLGPKTIAEFLELKNTIDTCVLTGVIANVVSTKYGNFDLVEGTDTLYIYGLKDATGANCFESESLEEGDTLTIKAVYTTYNNAPQAKNAIFVEVKKAGSVTPGAEVEITIADGSFSDYVESYGYWLVEAQNVDYYISLSNDNTQITQAAGTYTAADLYAKDSYILTETDSISFVSGSIVLDVDAEGVATVTGSLVGNDGNTYILNIVCPAPDEHEYDEDSDFIRNFSSYTINTEYLSEYGDINVEASDADGYQITLDLYVPTGASGLVAGTYEINSTYEAGTVAAGIFYDGGIYPSFAGIATTEGLTNVWYLVSGTVVVDANLNITVNAVNSLGHTINVTLKASGATGIEETLATGKAVKVLRNGQLLIMKGEKTFDVMGARIR